MTLIYALAHIVAVHKGTTECASLNWCFDRIRLPDLLLWTASVGSLTISASDSIIEQYLGRIESRDEEQDDKVRAKR